MTIPEYYKHTRKDILPLLPEKIERILEIGCGTGNTLAWIKNEYHCKWAGGVEVFVDAAEEAKSKIDSVFNGNIESMELPIAQASLDVILCLDVLEHLVDPWELIKKMTFLLKSGGTIITSIPNTRNFHVTFPLLFLGEWNYTTDNFLDKSHLRFFTRKTAISTIECSGLSVDMVVETGFEKWTKARIANVISFGLLKPIFVYEYLIRAKKG